MSDKNLIPNRNIVDIAITAAEGGTGYWAQIYEYDWKPWDSITDDVMLPDCFLFYTIAELDERQVGYDWDNPMDITAGVIRRGVALAVEQGYTSYAHLEDDLDAILADVIIQHGVFGEVIYG